jgi:hypothetical protein
MPIPSSVITGIGLLIRLGDEIAANLEKRRLEGEAARDEAGDLSEVDAAHDDLQAVMSSIIARGKAPVSVDPEAVEANAPRIAELLREVAALVKRSTEGPN